MIYFIVFTFCIRVFKVPIPGMLDEDDGGPIEDGKKALTKRTGSKQEELHNNCVEIIKCFGGKENLELVSACATRLRVSVKDASKVDEDGLKKTGSMAVIHKKGGYQAVYGTKAELISSEINNIIG